MTTAAPRSAMPSSARAGRPATMRAAVLEHPERVALREVERPEPGPGEVLLHLEGSGVCASNVPVWEGRPWFSYPLAPGAPGHEGWGTVEALGDGVDGFTVGQRVVAVSGHAYAEWDVADVGGVVPVPDALAGRAIPGEPIGCAMNVFRRAEVRAGQRVAIVGVGFLGALLVQLCRNAGARVVAVSRRTFSLEVGKACGAEEAIPLDDLGTAEQEVGEWTRGEGCDRVIECVGLQEPLDLAGRLTRERGRLVIAGYHQDGTRQVDMQMWNWRGLDVINAHERDTAVYADGMRVALDEVAAGRLDLDRLITHRFPLDATGDALRATVKRPDGFLKAVVHT